MLINSVIKSSPFRMWTGAAFGNGFFAFSNIFRQTNRNHYIVQEGLLPLVGEKLYTTITGIITTDSLILPPVPEDQRLLLRFAR